MSQVKNSFPSKSTRFRNSPTQPNHKINTPFPNPSRGERPREERKIRIYLNRSNNGCASEALIYLWRFHTYKAKRSTHDWEVVNLPLGELNSSLIRHREMSTCGGTYAVTMTTGIFKRYLTAATC
ncbi:hypothetical protein TNCT_356951 [Trichonephila clavata]|uniref:Uncharacterized protein n=1 Tax=Trichonephila clavata TaxID=2740835 RepID=A0A8X6JZK5_TRICU|nr:hypothetical protein TNCT_356951 [Trichonephila clavata]